MAALSTVPVYTQVSLNFSLTVPVLCREPNTSMAVGATNSGKYKRHTEKAAVHMYPHQTAHASSTSSSGGSVFSLKFWGGTAHFLNSQFLKYMPSHAGQQRAWRHTVPCAGACLSASRQAYIRHFVWRRHDKEGRGR